jgi:prefoldin alpha subunit
MEKQEYLIRLGELQQEAERIGQENQNVERQINELRLLKINLESFSESKNENALISLGNGIYTKAELKSKELWVNIGSDTVVKKSVSETGKLIEEQIAKLESFKEQLGKEMGSLNMQLSALVENARQIQESGKS